MINELYFVIEGILASMFIISYGMYWYEIIKYHTRR